MAIKPANLLNELLYKNRDKVNQPAAWLIHSVYRGIINVNGLFSFYSLLC